MNKINYDEVKISWLNAVEAESRVWLAHIKRKVRAIKRIQRSKYSPIFYEAELLFNIFSFLNWLAHIDLREDKYVDEKDMVKWLSSIFKWPLDITESFWYCLRNPTMHLGRTSSFSEYDRKGSTTKMKLHAGFHPDLSFDPLKFQPVGFKPTESQDGYYAMPNPFKSNELETNFYFPGVYRKLTYCSSLVIKHIKELNKQQLEGLFKINRKILAFRIYK